MIEGGHALFSNWKTEPKTVTYMWLEISQSSIYNISSNITE
jgi:hypothetical protein